MSHLEQNLIDFVGEQLLQEYKERHPSSFHMIKVLAPNPNLSGELYTISEAFFDLGQDMFHRLQDGPELTAGLRKLVEAKDCMVRACLDTMPVNYTDR